MMKFEVLTLEQPDAWRKVLEQSVQHDFYHLPEYHALAEAAGEGTARLFHYSDGACSVAMPLLLRPLDELAGMQGLADGWFDATSVYGYPGPVFAPAEIPAASVREFQMVLAEHLRALRVVSVFSRLNPLVPHRHLLTGLGDLQVSQTVSIDLTLPEKDQWSALRRNHRDTIKKLRRKGFACIRDREWTYLDDFIQFYHETMDRVGARDNFYFPAAYFHQLIASLGERVSLIGCVEKGRMICGGLFIGCAGILQYHLGGARNDVRKLAPMKLVIDDVRRWAIEQGFKTFHLGGGATSRPNDSLLHFKRGFSPRVHEFAVWRWVLFPDQYRRLCERKSALNRLRGLESSLPSFFPEYRRPTIPAASVAPALAAADRD